LTEDSKKHKHIERSSVLIIGMRALDIAVLVCSICILPISLGTLSCESLAREPLAWTRPEGYVPRGLRGHSPAINTKPTWPPKVSCRPAHLEHIEKLLNTIHEQTQLIIELQQKVSAYEVKEELGEYWTTELEDVRWTGGVEKELLVVSRVNITNLLKKL
jgi:hypothetical protein